MNERALIEAIGALIGSRGGRVARWIGDDAAVVAVGGGAAVVSTDAMVEDVHFRLDWIVAADVGHRALAGALSDLAAMGAAPGEAYIALGVGGALDAAGALELVRGAEELAAGCGVTIAGGDVVRSPFAFVTVTVVGWALEAGAVVGRDGAVAGDIVGVTGSLGAAAAAVALLSARGGGRGAGGDDGELASRRTAGEGRDDGELVRGRTAGEGRDDGELIARYARPLPRLAEGRALAAAGVHAMIDLSDGLASDATLLATASGVALEIDLDALPLAAGVADGAAAASGGEDYELCFCAAPAARGAIEAAVADVSWIGVVRAGSGVRFLDASGEQLVLAGYEHELG